MRREWEGIPSIEKKAIAPVIKDRKTEPQAMVLTACFGNFLLVKPIIINPKSGKTGINFTIVSIKFAGSPFHQVDVINIYTFLNPEYRNDDSQSYRHLGSRHRHHQKHKYLA